MTKQEYLRKCENMGLNLQLINVFIDEKSDFDLAFGTYEEDGLYHFYRNLDDPKVHKSFESEEKLYDMVWDRTMARLYLYGYMNESITRKELLLDKALIYDYLKEQCKLQDYELDDAWCTLKQDFRVLNEFKYYILNDKFVPCPMMIGVDNWTVEKIYQETDLSLLASFSMMIFLKQKPKEAMRNLEGWKKRK